jgi:NADH dehydrogenase
VSPRTVVITGASGLIGRHLCDHFRSAGWHVRALLREPGAYPFRQPGVEIHRLDLPSHVEQDAFVGAAAVVHAAYATRARDAGEARRVNEAGTERVLAQARAVDARFVFISSLSAQPDATSYYARSKLALESRLLPQRDLAVRPGLVLAHDGGLALRIWRTVARTHLVPLLDGGSQVVQTVHVDDLCAAVGRAIERGLTGTVSIAEPAGLTMRDLLDALACAARVRALRVRIPAAPVLAILRAAERVGLRLPVSSDNLLGLVSLRAVTTRPDLERIGVPLRDARASIRELAPLVFGPRTRAGA